MEESDFGSSRSFNGDLDRSTPGGIASADVDPNDDLPCIAPIEAPTYTIEGSNGFRSTFELVERDGEMMLVLFTDETPFEAPEDDE